MGSDKAETVNHFVDQISAEIIQLGVEMCRNLVTRGTPSSLVAERVE